MGSDRTATAARVLAEQQAGRLAVMKYQLEEFMADLAHNSANLTLHLAYSDLHRAHVLALWIKDVEDPLMVGFDVTNEASVSKAGKALMAHIHLLFVPARPGVTQPPAWPWRIDE